MLSRNRSNTMGRPLSAAKLPGMETIPAASENTPLPLWLDELKKRKKETIPAASENTPLPLWWEELKKRKKNTLISAPPASSMAPVAPDSTGPASPSNLITPPNSTPASVPSVPLVLPMPKPPGPEAEVTFDYEAQQDDELTLKVGDVITDITQNDDGWCEGVLRGRRGVFPDNFVQLRPLKAQLLPELPKVVMEEAEVTFDYEAQQNDELNLKVGDVITNIAQNDDSVFPDNFVQLRPVKAQLPPELPKVVMEGNSAMQNGSRSKGRPLSAVKLPGMQTIPAARENTQLPSWMTELKNKKKNTLISPPPASSMAPVAPGPTGPASPSNLITPPNSTPASVPSVPLVLPMPKPPGEDQKREQALQEQLEARLSLMAAQLSEAQQKLNVEQKLSGQYKAERDQYEKDLGHTREELSGVSKELGVVTKELGVVRKELGEVREELADLRKEHSTCKTFWIVPHHNVTLLQKPLGGGAWGYVIEGQFRGQRVAVKCIHEAIITQHTIKRVYREICTMAQMCHPNLVQFIAAVLDDQGGPMIITELLDTTLRKAYEDSLLNMAQCVDILHNVASALSYLHELEAPIIHRDVSSANVLMKGVARDKWIAKLSDFGSANWARQACTMGEGAIVYTAPEAFPTHPSLDVKPPPQTTKIDVYSYGILMCEVTLGEFPDPDLLREMKEKMKTKHVLLHTLVIKCTQLMPDNRPTMAAVLKDLATIRMQL